MSWIKHVLEMKSSVEVPASRWTACMFCVAVMYYPSVAIVASGSLLLGFFFGYSSLVNFIGKIVNIREVMLSAIMAREGGREQTRVSLRLLLVKDLLNILFVLRNTARHLKISC